jgi:hypothetical protein
MSFQEKSAIAIIGALVVVYGAYFALVARISLTSTEAAGIAYKPLLVLSIVPVAVLAAVSHIVLAVRNPKEANAYDERDRLITLRAERLGGYVLAVGVFAAIVLAMFEFRPFYLANALMLTWVLAEITDNAVKIALYRREA